VKYLPRRLAPFVIPFIGTVALLPLAAQTEGPGETSGPPLAQLRITGFDPLSEEMTLTYQSGCETIDNNLYFGALDQVSTLSWSGERCGIGTSGTLAGFNPGRGSFFFVVVGNNGPEDGSYGTGVIGGTAVERSPFLANACGQVQNLTDTCTPQTPGDSCASSLDCPSRQTCVMDALGMGQCRCLAPFGGSFCQQCEIGFVGPDCRECDSGFLSNAFQFANDTDGPTPLEQLRCEPDVPGDCTDRRCSGNGTCQVVGPEAVCSCDEGYAGGDCEECAPDYEVGSLGDCVLGQVCRDAKCGGHGDCVATPFGDVTCSCDLGFSGVDCGGPDLAIASTSETFTLYDGETIVLEPNGGTGPFTWQLVEGPGRLVDCPLPTKASPEETAACPPGGAELTIIAPAGGIQDFTLVQVALFDTAGNQAAQNLGALPPTMLPFTGKIHSELLPFYSGMLKYMRARGIRGGSLAISKGGKIVGANGYGYRDAGIDADPFVNAGEGGPLVQPDSPFRLASVSKTLTAAAVRQTALDMGVSIFSSSMANRAATWVQDSIGFGLTSGAPPFDYNLQMPLTTDSRWANVTIAHLMNHHAGFYRDSTQPSTTGQPSYDANMLPFTEDLGDPNQLQLARTGAGSDDISYATMYAVAALQLQFDPRPTVENMIVFTAGTLLDYNPGGAVSTTNSKNYSNMGYILLGRVLEGLKGDTYDPDEPGVPMGWGPFPKLLQDYLCERSGIETGVFPGDAFNPQALEPYYRDLDFQGVESRDWNLAEGADKIRFNAGIQQWQFCQSGCPADPGAVWNDEENTPTAYGGIWFAERNAAGGLVATAPALLKFARNHRIKAGSPNDGSSGIGSLLPSPGTHTSSSSHNGSLPGTRTWLWQMAGSRTNWLPFDSGAWNSDPSAPLDLDNDGDVLINEGLIGTNCALPSDVAVAVLFNQRQDRRAPRGNVAGMSNSSNGSVYGRIIDYLGSAACQVEQQGWPQIADPPPVLIAQPPCN
jgi:CubicO group peptidase (beta-lactamase class C family)